MTNRVNEGHGARRAVAAVAGTAVVAAVLGGCAAKVKQEVYDQDMAEVREDIARVDDQAARNAEAIAALSGRVDGLAEALETLQREFDARITALEDGIRFAMPVHFEFDRAEIRPVDRPGLDRFADVVRRYYADAMITVEGFADPAGSAAYNERLSLRRARAVADYLSSQGGLDGEWLRTVGYGETRQVRPGEQGPGRSGLENRRVTFVVEWSGGVREAADATG